MLARRAASLLSAVRRAVRPRWAAPRRFFCSEEAAAVPAVSQILAEVKCEEHADKFESLEKFLNTSSRELKESGIEQSQQRRLIMKKVEYARQLVKFGQFEKEYPAPPPPPVEEDAGGAEDGAEAATEDA